MKRTRLVSPRFIAAHMVALHVLAFCFIGLGDADPQPDLVPQGPATATGDTAPQSTLADELARHATTLTRPGALDLKKVYRDHDRLLADLGEGWTAELTTDGDLQARITRILNRSRVPFGAVVMLDVSSGEVLALADRYDERHPVAPRLEAGGPPHLALRAFAPAASVFKIITAASLMDDANVSTRRAWPHKTGTRRIYLSHLGKLKGRPPRATLGEALAKSNNGVFARLADGKLEREVLLAATQRFGFNQVIPFPLLTDASTARVPRNRLERARMAAGFWHTQLTPLHGALIAAAVARGGRLPAPRLVRRLEAPDGRMVQGPARQDLAVAMKASTAKHLRQMMAAAVRSGTARRAFSKWPSSLQDVQVAGKTGSLASRDPYTGYTWFVGFAPVEAPEVAIAVMVGNGELWWQRATDIARDALAARFKLEKKRARQRADRVIARR